MSPAATAATDHFAVVAGRRIHHRRAGSHGTDVLLLHGNGQSARIWDEVVPALAADHPVTMWDMPGQGDSDPLSTHLDIEDYAAALRAFVDQVGIAPAHVIGTSVGGHIAAALAAVAPDSLRSLTLIETNYQPLAWWVERWDLVEERFTTPVQDAQLVAGEFRALTDDRLARWNTDRSKAGRSMMSVMWAIRDHGFPRDLLAGLRVPVLVIDGDRGPAISCRDAVEDAITDVRVRVLPDCRHFPMVDDPAALGAEILAFTRRIDES